MEIPRSFGGRSLTRTPSIVISPLVMSSKPAIRRSSVDLPQPDGPTKTVNSLSSISRSTPWMISTPPKLLRTPRRVTLAMVQVPPDVSSALNALSLDGAGGQPRNDLPLEDHH